MNNNIIIATILRFRRLKSISKSFPIAKAKKAFIQVFCISFVHKDAQGCFATKIITTYDDVMMEKTEDVKTSVKNSG